MDGPQQYVRAAEHAGIERLVPGQAGDTGLLQRHLAGYAYVVRESGAPRLALDCGCGVGYGTHILASHCGPTIGLDREPAALRYAREHYPAPLGYLCADGLHIPCADGSFDLIVVSQVLEHFEDPGALCRELIRVAAPAARAFFMVPNAWTRAPGGAVSSSHHAREYDPESLAALLRKHFRTCSLLGSFPGRRMARCEGADTWARRSVAGDRAGLRRLVPRSLRQWLLARLRGERLGPEPLPPTSDLLPYYDPDCFEVRAGDLRAATDLVAVCHL